VSNFESGGRVEGGQKGIIVIITKIKTKSNENKKNTIT
jgi:hypothetical protein